MVLIERFDPVSALEAIERHGVTIVPGAPAMWTAWAALPEATRDSVRHGAAGRVGRRQAVRSRSPRQCEHRFGVTISEGYGLTEASPVVTTASGSAPSRGRSDCRCPACEVRLVDSDGDDVLVGDCGRDLGARPERVRVATGTMRRRPRARSRPMVGCARATSRWSTTTARSSSSTGRRISIIVSGFNVYPAEVEDVILEHPGIEGCAVIGVPHPYSGESVKAYVVVAPGKFVEEDSIIAFCAERLARYKCPDKVMFVDELPTALGGKILRRALR